MGGIALVFKEFGEFLKAVSESGLEVYEVLGLLGGVLLGLSIAVGVLVAVTKGMSVTQIVGIAVILVGLTITIKSLTKLIDSLSKSNMKLTDVLIGLGTIFTTIIAFMAATVAVSKVLSSNPKALLGVVAVVAALSVILLVLKETLPTILDALAKFINEIAPSVIELTKTIGEIIDKIIYTLGTILPPILESTGKMFESIFNGIKEIVLAVGSVIESVFNGISGVIRAIGDTVCQILEGIGNLIESISQTILNFVYNIGPAIENSVDAIIRAVTKMINFVISGIEYLVNRVIDGINGMAQTLNNLPFVDIPMKGYVYIPRFNGYAEGGFPEDGFFFANHSELVGEFSNGRTAVANNEQIIQGIQNGVFNGMMSALQNTDFGGNVVIEANGDTSGLLDFITFKQKQKERQFN